MIDSLFIRQPPSLRRRPSVSILNPQSPVLLLLLLAGVVLGDTERDAQERLDQLRGDREKASRVAQEELDAVLQGDPASRSRSERYAARLLRALRKREKRLDQMSAPFIEASEFWLAQQAQERWEKRERHRCELTDKVIRSCAELEQKLRAGKPVE